MHGDSVTSFISDDQRDALIAGIRQAGEQVMAIYNRDFEVTHKADESPLTEADTAAHHALMALLNELTPDFPVLSEESATIDYETRRHWQCYWLIDPLDGTKEFIKRSGEFTLNVALIERGKPCFGVVHAPALDTTWWGEIPTGAWKQEGNRAPQPIRCRSIPQNPDEREPWKVVGSREHGSAEFETFCALLPPHERVSMGSSLKFCLVAEGRADIYPRLAPTSEWDTAAAHAIVLAAGGQVLNAGTLKPLRYNQQESVLNPFFIACNQRDQRWEHALTQCLEYDPGGPYEYRVNDSKAEVVWNRSSVTPAMRLHIKGHAGKCIWFTGLSGSGKSTLANALEVELNRQGYHTMLLDGDNIRHGLCKDLAMSEADRTENIRRIGEVAKLFVDAGIIVITAFISPFRSDRAAARELFDDGDFIEVHVDTPLAICEQRDPKGLYQRARTGELKDFTGINSPYENPKYPEVLVRTTEYDLNRSLRLILDFWGATRS